MNLIYLSSKSNAFAYLFYSETNEADIAGINNKSRFLGKFKVKLKNIAEKAENETQNENYANMASAIATAITTYTVFLINPVISAPLALLSLASYGINLKKQSQLKRNSRNI